MWICSTSTQHMILDFNQRTERVLHQHNTWSSATVEESNVVSINTTCGPRLQSRNKTCSPSTQHMVLSYSRGMKCVLYQHNMRSSATVEKCNVFVINLNKWSLVAVEEQNIFFNKMIFIHHRENRLRLTIAISKNLMKINN